MVYRIVQYIQPWEIDDLDRQAEQLIRGSYYLSDNSDTVIWDVTMNTEIVDWQNSNLPESYFLDKFEHIKTKVSYYFEAAFDTDTTVKGCTDKRRICANKQQDFIIWLDSDLYFPDRLLPLMVIASKELKDENFILTPQIIKYWDHSWDCITNPAFLDQPHNHRDFFDLYSVDSFTQAQDQGLVKNNQIKFGGGWFNLIRSSIFTEIPLIEELGAYAPDDTYLSICGMKLNIPQYILTGVVVSEVGKKFLVGKDYLKKQLAVKIQDKQKITDQELYKQIDKFYAEH